MEQPSDDVLDDLIWAGAHVLRLEIEPEWLPAIRQHLSVSFRLANLVEEFELGDAAEPAPIFEA